VNKCPIIVHISCYKLVEFIQQVLRHAVGLNMDSSVHTQKLWWKVYSLSIPFNLIQLLVKLKEYWNIVAPQQLLKAPKKQLEFMEYFFNDIKLICKLILHLNNV